MVAMFSFLWFVAGLAGFHLIEKFCDVHGLRKADPEDVWVCLGGLIVLIGAIVWVIDMAMKKGDSQ